MRKIKKLISLLCVLTLIFGLSSTAAFADGIDTTPVNEIEVTTIITKNMQTGEVTESRLPSTYSTAGVSCEPAYPADYQPPIMPKWFDGVWNERPAYDRRIVELSSNYMSGTGFVFANRAIGTIGHVMYDPEIDALASWVKAVVRDKNGTVLKSRYADYVHVIKHWVYCPDGDDITREVFCVAEFNDETFGQYTGYYGFTGDAANRGTAVTISGYVKINPSDTYRKQVYATGKIANKYDGYVGFKLDADKGMSGSPLYDSGDHVLAVTQSKDVSLNYAYIITTEIANWMKTFRQPK